MTREELSEFADKNLFCERVDGEGSLRAISRLLKSLNTEDAVRLAIMCTCTPENDAASRIMDALEEL